MNLVWAAIAPFVPIIAILVAALAIGLFIVWLAVGGVLWAARAGRADGADLDDNPAWFAALPAESSATDGTRS
jgi:hypothetical protein